MSDLEPINPLENVAHNVVKQSNRPLLTRREVIIAGLGITAGLALGPMRNLLTQNAEQLQLDRQQLADTVEHGINAWEELVIYPGLMVQSSKANFFTMPTLDRSSLISLKPSENATIVIQRPIMVSSTLNLYENELDPTTRKVIQHQSPIAADTIAFNHPIFNKTVYCHYGGQFAGRPIPLPEPGTSVATTPDQPFTTAVYIKGREKLDGSTYAYIDARDADGGGTFLPIPPPSGAASQPDRLCGVAKMYTDLAALKLEVDNFSTNKRDLVTPESLLGSAAERFTIFG